MNIFRLIILLIIFGFIGLMLDRLREKEIQRTEQVNFYNVDAKNLGGILEQFKTRGPSGYAATTTWRVSWNWRCEVAFSSTITMPRHIRLDEIPETQQRNWANFVKQLQRHEEIHARNGEMAAMEIQKAWCFGGGNILRYWQLSDDFIDVKTKHGRTDGVVLGWR